MREHVVDGRFGNLKDLVHLYAGMAPNEDKENTFIELYRLIMLLMEEKRINEGKGFEFESYGETEIQGIKKQLELVMWQLDKTNQRINSTNRIIKKAVKEGWALKR